MPKYVIEREIPGAGNLSKEQLRAISQKSCSVLMKLGPAVQWLHSYVTGDKVYCVYIAPNEQALREHAKQGGFPANRVSQVMETIDPTTAEVSQLHWLGKARGVTFDPENRSRPLVATLSLCTFLGPHFEFL
jgi:hypothetical protein